MSDLRCLLVEDQQMFLELLLPMLQTIAGLSVVATAGTARAAIAAIDNLEPDLLILDLHLPDLAGINVAEALRRRRPQARLIVLSGAASSFLCPRPLQPLLHAVVDKTNAFQVLRREITRLSGEPGPATAPEHQAIANPPGPSLPAADLIRQHRLTQREREVLTLVGQGCSSRAIASALGISELTVTTHRRALRTKLGVSGAELVRRAALSSHGL